MVNYVVEHIFCKEFIFNFEHATAFLWLNCLNCMHMVKSIQEVEDRQLIVDWWRERVNVRAMQSVITCLALVCISHGISATDSAGNISNTRQEKLFRWVVVLGYRIERYEILYIGCQEIQDKKG